MVRKKEVAYDSRQRAESAEAAVAGRAAGKLEQDDESMRHPEW